MKTGNGWFGRLDDGFFKLGHYSAGLGREIAKLHGNDEAAKRCDAVANGFDAARGVVSCARVVFPVHRMVTGQIFWKTKEVKVGDKATLQWVRDGNGAYKLNDWLDIAMDVLVLIARLISPVRWGHNMKVYDLGKTAAPALTGATMGLWGAVLTLNLVQKTRDLIEEEKEHEIFELSWNWIQGSIDLLALPFDFGLGAQHPALAITGACFNIASAASLLARDAAMLDIKNSHQPVEMR